MRPTLTPHGALRPQMQHHAFMCVVVIDRCCGTCISWRPATMEMGNRWASVGAVEGGNGWYAAAGVAQQHCARTGGEAFPRHHGARER